MVLIARSLLVSVIVCVCVCIKKVDIKKIGYSDEFLEPMIDLGIECGVEESMQKVWA